MHDFGKLVYLEMQKTGSTYVNKFLRDCCLSKELKHKKHNVIKNDYDIEKFYFISIRDPLSLYSSLYRYGLDGRGGMYKRIKHGRKSSCYSSIESFMSFITCPKNSEYVGGGYNEEIATHIGIMSFRFMRLSLQFPLKQIGAKLRNGEDLLTLQDKFITNLEIKNENLNDELVKLSTELFPDLFDQEKVTKFFESSMEVNVSSTSHDDNLQKKLEQFRSKLEKKEALLFSRY
tara:strand:+ start:368 stop:1063 length:696 start_codon:yes stop_codon:yes gene_type:complete